MANLFEGTHIPEWLSGSPGAYGLESEKAAESIGRTFGAAFNAAAGRKQEMEQFSAQLPLKQKALENEADQNTLGWLNFVTKQDLEKNKSIGYADVGQVVAKVGDYEGGWNSPQYQKDFWATAAKHPEVIKDPQFKSITDNFDLAQKAQYNADLASQRDTIKMQMAAENRASNEKIAAERNAAMLDAQQQRLLHSVRDRFGDMGYRAFQGEISSINSDLLMGSDEKQKKIQDLYKQVEGGKYRPANQPLSQPPAGAPRANAAQSAPSKVPTATNPQTGERLQYINGQWIPIQ